MSQDVMDRAITENFPVIAMPHSGYLPKPANFGIRYVVGRTGLFREVSTPWLYTLLPVAVVERSTTPYGDLTPKVEMTFNMPPETVWRDFMQQAKLAMPNECAALIIWNSQTGAWRLAAREATLSRPDRVDYAEPVLEDDELAVIDIHSHASYSAHFSRRDDADDAGGIKISAVVGRINQPEPDIALRLVCLDRFVPMRLTPDGCIEVRAFL